MGVNKFIREELGAGLLDAGYNKESAENVAKEVLSASHKVRHEAQIDGAYISLIAGAGQGGSKVLEKKEMDTLRKVGKVKVSDMPITGIFPIVVKSFKKLVKPAEQGSANAITKRVCFVFECECEAEHK